MLKKWFNLIDDTIATLALSLIIILTVVNVFGRFVLNSPISWVEEICLALFVWLVFIGISSAMKRDGHIGVDYFILKMPKPLRIFFLLIRAAAIYYVLIYVFIILGYDLTSQAISKQTPVLGISYQIIDIAVPIGGILTAIHFTRTLIKSFSKEVGKEGGGS